jgi:feruloyl esterase
VAGQILNHPTSRIMFEVWMPTQVANERFVQVGNGGFAGNIQYGAMATRLREGYATASTDDGTSAPPGVPSNQRLTLLGDFERLYDFKGRAVTLTTGVAKTLYSEFYGTAPDYSYFTGCSTGGLEALAVAQRIGDQFDGVSAGSPANNSAGLFTQALWTREYYQKISTKLPLINDAVLAACDAAGDGIVDGVVGNPEKCNFNPAVLMCSGGDQPDCLTAEQVDAVRRIHEGPVDPATGTKTGEEYAPGMPFGSELVWNSSVGQAAGASQPWYGMVLYGSLSADLSNFDYHNDVKQALELTLPYGAQVTDPDLSTFRAHGGKLLMWAGWNDQLWSQANLVRYYRQVVAEIRPGGGEPGQENDTRHFRIPPIQPHALNQTKEYARLFMGPGVGHCGGGAGAGSFDTFPPLIDWVEGGAAPERIIASRVQGGEVQYTRPMCPYPAVARWDGSGDPDSADSYACVAPEGFQGE